ncbi:MAG: putative secreted protein with C-terminal beta-propeller domain, partial [Myxococcota bacterium]
MRHLMFGLTALVLTGCKAEQKEATTSGYSLQRFSDCSDMRDHIEDAWTQAVVYSHYGYGYYGWGVDDAESGVDGDASGGDGPSGYSETNTQEAGVDEPDMVKTDGEHLFILHDQELSIVKSWPVEDAEEVASLTLEGWPSSAFLRDGRLVVFGYDNSDDFYDEDNGWYSSATRVTIVDVTQPTAPSVERSFLLEGYTAGARMIDGEIYIAMQDYSWYPYDVWQSMYEDGVELDDFSWWDATTAEREAAFEEAGKIVRPYVESTLDKLSDTQLLPRVSEDGSVSKLMDCSDLYHPDTINSASTLALIHLDQDGGLSGTGVMSEGWLPYASTDNFYVAQTSWWWAAEEDEVETHIHRFQLDEAQTRYAGSGSVAGWVLNQFSMGEHDGHLRVATTDAGWWGEEEPANNVFVLKIEEDALEKTGEIRGIAPGERIYSARFAGDRGYVVTFEQVDPLFTLDLADPAHPTIAGELKVPGFSSYLHPIGEDHILAIGMDGTDDGQITGLAVSLFDISDFSSPALLDKYTLDSDDWSYSQALYDHHAFTYYNGTLS